MTEEENNTGTVEPNAELSAPGTESTDLLQRIKRDYPSFSKSWKKIGSFILSHYDKAAYMTASKLGEAVGVSESTVVRFALGMEYEGYPELQHALRELIRSRLTAMQRIKVTNALHGQDPLHSVMRNDMDMIRDTMEGLSPEVFSGAVDAIIGARTVYIIGMRRAAMLSGFLAYNLGMICDNVRQVQTVDGSELFEQLLRVGEGDVVFAISFPRYSTRVVKAVSYAKDAGAKIIALTDGDLSPIAGKADWLLTAQSDMASFCDSLVAPLSLIDALLVAIAARRESECSETFEKLENIWKQYGVYTHTERASENDAEKN